MKVFHLADTHIGYSAYNKLDENGINQRETDVCNAFARIVDIAVSEKPDLVLHSGDLFDTVRPSNRAISFVVGQLLKLSSAGIPAVIISGNHSTPRLRETGSVFKVFEHIEGIHLAYDGTRREFEFGDVKVHALPHSADRELFDREMAAMAPDRDFGVNIAMLHAAIAGMSVFRMNEFNELMASTGQLDRGFDYVALGHYHEHCEVAPGMAYAGSTERFGFGEVGQQKGFVELNTGTGKRKFRKMDARRMLDLDAIDCTGMKADDVEKIVRDNLESADIADAIIRQKLQDIDRKVLGQLDTESIRRIARDALHFELRPSTRESGQKIATSDAAFDSLEREFMAYMAKAAIDGADAKTIENLGLRYLASGGDEE
ncbi:MAG: DNA repair exonuclease [Thermoplasmata archaeon]